MNKLIARIIGVFFLVYLFTEVFGLGSMDSIGSAVVFSIIFLCVNAILKPILLLVSLPITLLTLGIFSLVVNTWIVLITAALVPGIKIHGFFAGFLLSLAISIFHLFFIKPMKD